MSDGAITAAIFDLDGVITRTATLHARAWKVMFDSFLETRAAAEDENHAPFDIKRDYLPYVDGKPREDGIRSFLRARGIEVPDDVIRDLGERKNPVFLDLLDREGVQTFDDAVEQVSLLQRQGVRTALITSSRNGRKILEATGLLEKFEVIVDGNDSARLGIIGKPAPDIFLYAAKQLGVEPVEAMVIEDAISGVEAGVAGGFGLVVGVARNGGDELREAGAHIVVGDLTDLRGVPLKPVATGGEG
jgi:beta-phosphoglucomutase family hydrolase